jgi:metal-dependent amidase/aminoacylase/carboxypeptidase family protein
MKHVIIANIVTVLFFCHNVSQGQVGQKKDKNEEESIEAINEKTINLIESLIDIRRELHMYPELSGQEQRTSNKIEKYLLNLGLEVHTNIGGFGVVGILNGANSGKRIAWRADIDALPITSSNMYPFESKIEGVAHLCGHDVHTTVALGIATFLSSQKENINGTVYFVFQPSEENLKGAQAMIDDGLFDLISPDEFYALHITPFPAGTIAVKSEEMFASLKKLKLTLKTSDTEGLVEFAKDNIKKLQNIDPNSEFWSSMNMGDPNIGIAGPNTIYKDFTIQNGEISLSRQDSITIVETYLSFSDRNQQKKVISNLKMQFAKSKYAEFFISADLSSETPTLLNDESLTEEAIEYLNSLYGTEKIISLTGVVSDGRSDDFALFQERIPAVYFFLGGSNYEENIISEPHSPSFLVDETCIKTGVEVFSSLLLERLKRVD